MIGLISIIIVTIDEEDYDEDDYHEEEYDVVDSV